ncbi:alpha/beta fold hydrolase [Streptoalloteichus hindustanus]|uniref:Alpha/beta hydrolase family protein n=1 Tax=Streptoalloteichus hindustanus TaxID=2017 RepID=A0A1M5ELU7_STRHI|nr:alpha/beta fold hydrolase [Streptoalloteichus hindustanus]SHF80177.1 Alpha/beta hydrolase family protein [Streptoalloteichus hindustanus]
MTTFVLVPGAWHGGWWFEPFARELRRHGHEAYALTLTGVGDRSHLMSASVNLDTHIQDVVNVLEIEGIEDAVLCGHSYGGMVVSGVADRVPERLRALVYADAFVPADGESVWDQVDDTWRQIYLSGIGADGYAMRVPDFGLDPRASAHPLATVLQRIRLTGAWERVPRRHYIHLSGFHGTPLIPTYERLRQDPAWTVHNLPVGHNILATAPEEFLKIMLAAAE